MTAVALLTPPGMGAIATVAVRGSAAWSIAHRLFQRMNGQPLPEHPQAGQFWYGRVGGERGDEVVLAVRRVEPEVWTEYHCHGGKLVTAWLLKMLQEANCSEIGWSQFLAVTDATEKDPGALPFLVEARTLRTASILLDQYQGAYRRVVREALTALQQNDIPRAQTILTELLRYADIGLHLTRPWHIAIAGAPNAGKSSLINALAGYQRSVVAPIPGTTRDVVTTTVAFDGWPVELSDTAGLRVAADTLEQAGIARARQALAEADLCLWLIDITGEMPPAREEFAAENGLPVERIFPVLNKIDQPPAWDNLRFKDAVRIAALHGTGIDELIRRFMQRLVPDDVPPGAAVPYSPEQIRYLQQALAALAGGEIETATTYLAASISTVG